MASSPSVLSASQRRLRRPNGVFSAMIANEIGFGPRALANLDYGRNFKKVPSWGDNEKFVNSRNEEFEAQLFGQLSADTNCHPIGNYSTSSKKVRSPLYIPDST
jgi:hypothetical protein